MSDADIRQLASCLNQLQPDRDRVEMWIGCMASGDFKFGYGLLRTADDEYDPFGVLAVISPADWTWDENEEAWAINGSAIDVSGKLVMEWLGVTPDTRSFVMAEVLRDTVIRIADGSSDFSRVVDCLRRALDLSLLDRQTMRRLADIEYSTDHRGLPMLQDRVLRDSYRAERYGGPYPAFYENYRR